MTTRKFLLPNKYGKSGFAQILQIEHILLVIVPGLHYADLVSLSRTSKSIRELVFPHGDLFIRREKFRRKSCHFSSKTRCWNCNIMICNVCTPSKHPINFRTILTNSLKGCKIPQSEVFICEKIRHIEGCKLCCTKCFYKRICRSFRSRRKPCKCPKPTTAPEAKLCRFCAELDDKRAMKEAYVVAKIKSTSAEQNDCAFCEKKIVLGGIKWWICSTCRKECLDHLHASRATKSKNADPA